MPSFKSLKKPLLSQEVERQLRDSITDGSFKPNEKLPSERELVDQFQVSRVTVREALKSLRRSGLIEVRRGMNAGAYVCELNADAITENFQNLIRMGRVDFCQLIEARLLLEPATARTAALQRTPQDLEKLENLLARAERLAETSCRQARLLNVSFHCEVAKISRNPIIIFITESITQAYSEFLIENTSQTVGREQVLDLIRQHREILKAVTDQDSGAAYEKTRRHLENACEMYERVVHDKCEKKHGKRY